MATKVEDVENAERRRERRLSEVSVISRGKWGSKWEFLLSCIGLSVGIGNVWRFPYLAYQNGGGAFLIPYLIMLILVGKPMYFLELAFGQFAGVGPIAIWSCVPMAKGIGFAMVTVCLIICIYYNVIMSYCIYFIASSFTSVLPWTECMPEWNDTESNTICITRSFNKSLLSNDTKTEYPSALYFNRYVLDQSEGLNEIGTIKWDLSLCLLLSWIIVVICLVKGIKTSGKVVYFASTFPYVILITLLITGFLQEGAWKGVLFFITPDFNKLLSIEVWQAAAGQMFFSLSVSMGALIMYSSYNDFKNNVFRDAMIVSVMDTLTSIIAGMVIFSVIGAMAHELNVNIEDVVAGGPGLAFIAYPEALAKLPIPQLFSVLFFVMLFVLGLDSEFALLENVLTSVSDEVPFLRKHKLKFCIATSIFCYLVGLVFVTNGGLFVLDIVDNFGGSLSVIFIAIFESIAICWVYGLKRLRRDIKFMLGTDIGWYWRFTWMFTCPLVLLLILIYSLITHKSLASKGDPSWADILAWLMTMVSVIQIPIWAIIMTCLQKGPSLREKLGQALSPTEAWGPANEEHKAYWLAHCGGIDLPSSTSMSVLTTMGISKDQHEKVPYTNGTYTSNVEDSPPPPYPYGKDGINNPSFKE